MKLAYGSNNIGFGSSWVAVVPSSGLSPSVMEMLRVTTSGFGEAP
jgi:hypothetical protein